MTKKKFKKCKKVTKKWYHTIGITNCYGFHFTENYDQYLKDKEKGLL